MNSLIDISKYIIRTKRLVLRPWTECDLSDFYEYAKVDGVGQMAGWLPHQSMDETSKILNNFIEEKKTFAIEYKGKVIGSLGIEEYSEGKFPQFDHLKGRSIGYVLSKDYWGQGLMPEAVQAVIKYLFDIVKLDFIMISHFIWNHQSARVIEKCGFTYLCDGNHTTRYGTKEETREYILKR